MNLTFDLARKVVVLAQKNLSKYWICSSEEATRIIDECDVKAAKKVLKNNENLFKGLLSAAYYDFNEKQINALFNVFINGMDSVLVDPDNIVGNWYLDGGWINNDDFNKVTDHVDSFVKGKKIGKKAFDKSITIKKAMPKAA